MTVHVLMPIFNRLEMTRSMLADLNAQQLDEPLSVIVIDDGSSDGTAQYLRDQTDITVLKGNGSLWWGGAVDLGMKHVLDAATPVDWVLLVNNDTRVKPDFIQRLLDAARRHAPAAIGSVIRDLNPPHRILSIGPRINAWRIRVFDALDLPTIANRAETGEGLVEVDALSGRGVLFPVAALRAVSGMRSNWLPHYLADYELSLRVKAAGWQLVVEPKAVTLSTAEYGNVWRGRNLRERLFERRSPSYLPAKLRFWWAASSVWLRLTLPCRAAAMLAYRIVRNRV